MSDAGGAQIALDIAQDLDGRVSNLELSGENLDRSLTIDRNGMDDVTEVTFDNSEVSFTRAVNGWGLTTQETNPWTGTTDYVYDNAGLLIRVSNGGRTISITRDLDGNPTAISGGGMPETAMTYNVRGELKARVMDVDPVLFEDPREEVFHRDLAGNLREHEIVDVKSNYFEYDAEGRLTDAWFGGTAAPNLCFERSFSYGTAGDGLPRSDFWGAGSTASGTTWTYDANARLETEAVTGIGNYEYSYGSATGRLIGVGGGGATYEFEYDPDTGYLTAITDAAEILGGDARMEHDPDEAGHALTRRLKMDNDLQFTLTRPINDAGAVLSSTFAAGTA